MKDTLLAILVLAASLIGVPLLIVWAMDRDGTLALLLKRVVGAISLFFGVAISSWIVYNVVHPTEEFEASFHTMFQVATPIAMVYVGWRWLTSKRDEQP